MSQPVQIQALVERFALHYDAYKSGQYNETHVRREFLDPFFKALGWDMDNTAGKTEAYKDVFHEDKIRVAGALKAPDYSFRLDGTRKFFLEAKNPSINIKQDISHAFQLRRYAWSAKLPLSLLSDFEEFAVYDGRFKPHKDHPAITARIFYCTFREYAEKWDWIYERFSREAVYNGGYDKFAEACKSKRGTVEVDVAFLETIEGWRKELAQNLALRNARLSQRELNFAVQRIIDRLIFLRICEARGIEDYGRLQALINGDRIYPRLAQLFEQADDRYNSGLFHFKKEPGRHEAPDELTLDLDIDDKLLRGLLRDLYFPDSPYEFSVFTADVLGQVYEQFLGKVIRLTDGHRAVVDDKPEVKKAGGVYYTPTYIVDYIVRQTVGKIVAEAAGRLPAAGAATGLSDGGTAGSGDPAYQARSATTILSRVARLRVLDPACGSGSFLIGAYQFLLDWHLEFYLANEPVKFTKGSRPALVQTGRGWKLTIAERKRILLANIYGVDLDAQAVEVTKLSLLLKVLEGETGQALQTILRIFQERALPDLGDNIKCGNSLIGPDFYQQSELPLLTDEQRFRINVFDWQAEFPHIFQRRATGIGELHEAPAATIDFDAPGMPLHGSFSYKKLKAQKTLSSPMPMEPEWEGGFDAVIGNPPYIRIQTMQDSQPQEVEYFSRAYKAASQGNYDIYVVFVERGLGLLNKSGKLGFILPNKFFNAQYGQPLRVVLSGKRHLEHIVHFGDQQVFSNATTYTCLLFLGNAGNRTCDVIKAASLEAWRRSGAGERASLPASRFAAAEWNIEVGAKGALRSRLPKLGKPLGEIAQLFVGLQTSADKVFVLQNRRQVEAKMLRPFLTTGGLRAYQTAQVRSWMIFPYELADGKATLIPAERMRRDFPKTWAYLKSHEKTLRERDRGKWNHDQWYAFGRSQNLTEMGEEKLVIQVTAINPTVILDAGGLCMTGGGAGPFYGIRLRPSARMESKYLLGILNSKVFGWIVRTQSTPLRGGYFKYSKQYIETTPIPQPDKPTHDRMVKLVDTMLALHPQLAAARTPQEQTVLQRQLAATDMQIDRLAYDLYGLTADEINIVEGKAEAEMPALPAVETVAPAAKPKRVREKSSYAAPPPGPPQAGLTPEKAYSDSAHFYGKEEGPPYRTEGEPPCPPKTDFPQPPPDPGPPGASSRTPP